MKAVVEGHRQHNKNVANAHNVGLYEKRNVKKSSDSKKYASGFSSLNLPFSIMKGLHLMGYCQPTPIQKESIPILNQGRDIVAMARTGSGKTAAFIIPLLLKLNCTHSARVGARAIIIAPTRELAMQINLFVISLCNKANISLRTACLLGGDSISEQFSMLLSNPDIIIGTPGRILHLLAEITSSSIKETSSDNVFSAVQMIILDEADRLFEEATSSAQISLLFARFPQSRQVALFSATMPSQLLAFSKTGLVDPVLIRLDTESQLSKDLEVIHFDAQLMEKPALLLFLLENDKCSSLISYSHNEPGGMIFVATRHIAEFLSGILSQAEIKHGVLFGQMDQEARKLVLSSFRAGNIPLLIVTDVASRGIDIPSLQFIINYDFPSTPKLFVHRAGRVARAGKSGIAISFVSLDERPFLVELGSFQGIDNLQLVRLLPFGDLHLDATKSKINSFISLDADLENASRSAAQSLLKYQRTRPKASPASYSKAKQFKSRDLLSVYLKSEPLTGLTVFPDSKDLRNLSPTGSIEPTCIGQPISSLCSDETEIDFMAQLASYRPMETVFEAMRKGSRGQRSLSSNSELASIASIRSKKKQKIDNKPVPSTVFSSDVSDLSFKDKKMFVDYEKTDSHFERGLNIASFTMPEDEQAHNISSIYGRKRSVREWDIKKKRFVQREAVDSPEVALEKILFGDKKKKQNPGDHKKEIGQVYNSWKKQTHQELPRVGSIESSSKEFNTRNSIDYRRSKKNDNSFSGKARKSNPLIKSELKNQDQIIKSRVKKAAMVEHTATKRQNRKKK